MKFVTEMELRDAYVKEPFAAYILEKGTRLTPGARQFLIDRGINIIDQAAVPIKATNTGPSVKTAIVTPMSGKHAAGHVPTSEEKARAAAGGAPSTGGSAGAAAIVTGGVKKDWRTAKLLAKLGHAEAAFLRCEEELLATDVMLAQKVVDIGKQFRSIHAFAEDKGDVGLLSYKGCTGMNEADFGQDLGDCFEITEFHTQLPNGKTIVAIYTLRAELREVEPAVLEYGESCGCEEKCETIIIKTNEIINVLTQLLHGAVGGKECLREA